MGGNRCRMRSVSRYVARTEEHVGHEARCVVKRTQSASERSSGFVIESFSSHSGHDRKFFICSALPSTVHMLHETLCVQNSHTHSHCSPVCSESSRFSSD